MGSMVGLMIGLITLMTPAFARSITFMEHGMTLWIFIIIGAFIALLQLIPTVIVFFSFIGTITGIAFKKESKVEEKVVLLDTEPVEVRRQGNIMRGEI
jgi:predicted membrane protein